MPAVVGKRRVVRQKAKGPVDPTFGKRLRALRLSRNLSQAELAGTDFTSGFISLLETGRTRVSLRAAEVLARRLDASITDLFGSAADADVALDLKVLQVEQKLASGDPGEALRTADATLQRSAGERRARLLVLKGRALRELDRPREALAAFDDALPLFRAAHRPEHVVRTLFDQARSYARLDAPGEAINLALESERRINAGELVDRSLELQIHRLLANLYLRLGDVTSADLRADRALRLAEDIADPDALARIYAGLAITREKQGDLEAALGAVRKSIDLFGQLNRSKELAEAWNTLGWLYVQRRQLGRAEEALVTAERMARETKYGALSALILASRAELELARAQPEHARALAEESAAHPAATSYARSNALWIRAQAVAAAKPPLRDLRRAYDEAITAASSEPAQRRAEIHESYARILVERGEAREANAQFELALTVRRPTN